MSSSNNPIVSVILAVYNGEDYLKDAIDSILAQSFCDFELIIIDDASTDGTHALLETLTDSRIIQLSNPKNLGPYGAANRGIQIARGKYIARHDADDVSHPDRFNQQVQRLNTQSSLVLLGTSYNVIDRQGQIIDITLLPSENEELQKKLERGNKFVQGTVMIRRSGLEQVGGYREYFPVSQDYDLFLRLAEVGEIANLSALLYNFRFHGSSISRQKKELQLACRRLAWDLASQRRSGIEEAPIPEDVITSYPPEPFRLFLDARGSAYLYYAAKEIDMASKSMDRARYYYQQLNGSSDQWSDWILGRANLLSTLRKDTSSGAEFIKWVYINLGYSEKDVLVRKNLGQYFAGRAFNEYKSESKDKVINLAYKAFKNDPNWLKDRGLLAISVKSLRRQ